MHSERASVEPQISRVGRVSGTHTPGGDGDDAEPAGQPGVGVAASQVGRHQQGLAAGC